MALKEITLNGLGKFSTDEHGRLHWDNKAVLVEQQVTLNWIERLLVGLGAFGALLAGVHPFGASFGWW